VYELESSAAGVFECKQQLEPLRRASKVEP
jgi:hypothetical protein